jgi:hypothetical protein
MSVESEELRELKDALGLEAAMPRKNLVLSYQATADAHKFLCRVADGIGEMNAAAEVGWSPRVMREKLADPDLAEMFQDAKTITVEDIEAAVRRRAKAGNIQAAAMVLYSFGAERGWRPPQQRVAVATVGRIQVEVVEAAVQATRELLAAGNLRALQIGGALDAIDATSE